MEIECEDYQSNGWLTANAFEFRINLILMINFKIVNPISLKIKKKL